MECDEAYVEQCPPPIIPITAGGWIIGTCPSFAYEHQTLVECMGTEIGDRQLLFGDRSLLFGGRNLLFGDRTQSFGERSLPFGDRSLSFGDRSL